MIVPLEHHTWQLLRSLVRAEAAGKDLTGAELRIAPTRRTKDGTFLDELVRLGLIAVVAKATAAPAGASAEEKNRPTQFRTRYRLTPKGREAAEFGEYDRPYTPEPTELTGLAAALFGKPSNGKPAAKRGVKKSGK